MDPDHLRELLRSRASVNTSVEDTPSIYSMHTFSPRAEDVHSLRSFRPSSPPLMNQLASSLLDNDDDPPHTSVDSDDDAGDTVEDHDPRMSFLGPKMRVFEKAPWELSGTLEEEEEPEPRGRDGFKGMGFRSSSRGTTASGRPSGESSRSYPKPKRSFETTSSGRGSPFNTLSTASQPTGRTGLRLHFPVPRSESPSSASSPRAPASPRSVTSHHSNAPSPFAPNNMNKSPLTRRPTQDSTVSDTPYPEEEVHHPYANPELVVTYDDPSPTPNRSVFRIPSVARSEASTLTESGASLSRSVTGSTLDSASVTSMSPSQSPRMRASMFHGREISSPIPTISTAHISSPLMAPTMPPNQNFGLISLEEARAQRSRSSTANGHPMSTSSTPFPESADPSPPSSVASRSRARSISTGSRARVALQNIVTMPAKLERRDSEPAPAVASGPPAKTLKHKKSGFMRLFNGGRGSGDESPPPVPPLSDEYAAFNAQQSNGIRSAKTSIHRVPAPEASPSMFFQSSPTRERLSPKQSPPALTINTAPQGRLRAVSTVDDFQTRTAPSELPDRDWHQTDLPQSAPANVTEFPALKLRPMSTLFSAHFTDHMVLPDSDSQPSLDADADTLSSTSPISLTPLTPGTALGRSSADSKGPMATISEDQSGQIQALQEQLANSKKAWQRHIWELEGQVRDLKAEVNRLQAAETGGYCDSCGRGKRVTGPDPKSFTGVVNRPRARTGTSSRFGSGV
ncbi:hypothetical protein HMN09_00622200 [Mycena chlorophos]|uniref:Uncharacterized protein n=1 Tax=Mycena chlorophos TaxID=658473 RepID=A0A8H6T5K1_MYCCL|nr:hypothetical protein HMN09_00622200 [Mycena chlorophos]